VCAAQPRRLTLFVVGISLLNVRFVRRDERPGANELVDLVEDGALLGRRYQHRARTPALGPRTFQFDPVASVCIQRLKPLLNSIGRRRFMP